LIMAKSPPFPPPPREISSLPFFSASTAMWIVHYFSSFWPVLPVRLDPVLISGRPPPHFSLLLPSSLFLLRSLYVPFVKIRYSTDPPPTCRFFQSSSSWQIFIPSNTLGLRVKPPCYASPVLAMVAAFLRGFFASQCNRSRA